VVWLTSKNKKRRYGWEPSRTAEGFLKKMGPLLNRISVQLKFFSTKKTIVVKIKKGLCYYRNMKSYYFIEECVKITPKEIINFFRNAKQKGKDDSRPILDCWANDSENPETIYLSVGGKELQIFNIEWFDLTFGKVAFFNCSCTRRVKKLYSIPGTGKFKCRFCQGLRYRSSIYNPRSIAGISISNFEKEIKLMDKRAKISRIFYKGKYTKRYSRYLESCKKAGLNNILKKSNNLLEIIKSQ
jgi:hypothetical protein